VTGSQWVRRGQSGIGDDRGTTSGGRSTRHDDIEEGTTKLQKGIVLMGAEEVLMKADEERKDDKTRGFYRRGNRRREHHQSTLVPRRS
jgi:hypothetical protein